MPTAGCMRLNGEGRVVVSLEGPVTDFNGGTPVNADGAVVIEEDPPEAFLGGFGYKAAGPICARPGLGDGNDFGGFARTSVGGLALALTEPITGYTAGIPIVEDGRVAVAFDGPPPVNLHGFTTGFNMAGFD